MVLLLNPEQLLQGIKSGQTDVAVAYRRVMQDCSDVAVFGLVKWINILDTVIEKFVKNKADTCFSR
jgi:hypothetical protein